MFEKEAENILAKWLGPSFKTTLGGIAGLLGSLGGVVTALAPLADGDPDTLVDWKILGAAITALGPSVALLFARDNNVSSEKAGAKPAEFVVKKG